MADFEYDACDDDDDEDDNSFYIQENTKSSAKIQGFHNNPDDFHYISFEFSSRKTSGKTV